ncbi:Uncharacterised protein [Segatella copri]|nr:Uncharacterised protein [Segatella copri]
MDSSKHTTRVAVKLIFALGITDFLDSLAGNGLQININVRANLTHDYYLTSSTKGFDGAMSVVIVSQKLVKQCI